MTSRAYARQQAENRLNLRIPWLRHLLTAVGQVSHEQVKRRISPHHLHFEHRLGQLRETVIGRRPDRQPAEPGHGRPRARFAIRYLHVQLAPECVEIGSVISFHEANRVRALAS